MPLTVAPFTTDKTNIETTSKVTMKFRKIPRKKFEQRFQPLAKPNGDQLFDWTGKDLAFIQRQSPGTVWTLCDCDGLSILQDGFYRVNRLVYVVTMVAVPDGVSFEVRW